MSARSFLDRYGGALGPEDDGTYQAWQTCQQGSVMNLKIVPNRSTGEPVRHIPYLQPITIEHHRESDQLCLLCHSTGMKIFFEGRGLEELGDLISEKRIKVITMFDATIWQNPRNGEAVVTNISTDIS